MQLHSTAHVLGVTPGRHAGERNGVGDEHQQPLPFDLVHHAHEVRRQVVAVEDGAGGQALVGELVPDLVVMAVDAGRDTVAEVGAERGAGVDRCRDLLGGSQGVAQRDPDAAAGELADELDAAGVLRCDRHQRDAAAGRGLQAVEHGEVGWAYRLEWVSAARAVLRRDERTLEVDAGDRIGDELAGGDRLVDGAQTRAQVVFKTGDYGGQEARDTGSPVGAHRFLELGRRHTGPVEVHAV